MDSDKTNEVKKVVLVDPKVVSMTPALEIDATSALTKKMPSWMTQKDDSDLQNGVEAFVQQIKDNPTDIRLTTRVYKLGEDGSKEMMPHTALYDRKIAVIMEESKDGSPTNKSLLQMKQEIDKINPAVLSKQPIPVKVAILFTKMRLPKAQEVLDMIYSRRETVKSTVDGIKAGLWETRDRLTANIADLAAIYEGLLKGERLVERDRYFGELLIEKLTLYLPTIEDAIAKQNLEQVLADVTTAVINLKTEENANYLFFSGAQNLAKLTNMQISNINGISRLLERSVLANLGLRVVSAELATSINVTEQMKKTIGDTIKDTSEQINESTDKLIAARSSATINLDALEAACSQMEEVYEKMATANKEVIEKGGETSKHLSEMNAKLRQRVENSHNQMQPLDGGKQ